MKQKFLDLFMELAERLAKESYATKLKVGAMAVRDNKILSQGWNGTPPGFDNVCEDENNHTKPSVLHAEENLICHLAKSHESSKDAYLFTSIAPCERCARLIIASGFSKVYFRNYYKNNTGIDMLNQAKIPVIQI
jgi:dCMP deaminase